MSVRKRARTSEPAPPVSQHQPLLSQAVSLTPRWRTLPPELLQLVTSYLLYSPSFPFVQLLCRLSAVCVDWRGMVYRTDGGAGRADLWAIDGTATVVNADEGCEVGVAGRSLPASILRSAMSSLRPLRSLLLDFGYRRTLHGVVEGLDGLRLYTRLTSLHMILSGVYSEQTTNSVRGQVQAALDAALNTIASRPTPLASLTLHCCTWRPDCADAVRPTADVLRRLCSSVQHLSLSWNELMRMMWGTDAPADSSLHRAWQAHSIRSLALPPDSY